MFSAPYGAVLFKTMPATNCCGFGPDQPVFFVSFKPFLTVFFMFFTYFTGFPQRE